MDREALGELIRKFPVYPEAFNLDDDNSVIDSYYKELKSKHWDKDILEAHIERWRVIWSIDPANARNPELTTSEWDIVKKTYNIDEVYPCFVAFMAQQSQEELDLVMAKYGKKNMDIAAQIVVPVFLVKIELIARERGIYDKVVYIQMGNLTEMF